MKKIAIVVTVVVALMLALAVPVFAGSPITHKVTGGGHFTSDAGNTVGNVVYLSLVGMEKNGAWSGEGSYRDPDIGLKAHLVIDDGFLLEEGYVCFEGTTEVYINNVSQGAMSFRVCVTDGDHDGSVDRIGVIIDNDIVSPFYHYSHMGYTVTDYTGCIKIH
jgi:hypothetical protein